jgi:hypothetical protein
MSAFTEFAAYAFVAVCAIYGLYELALRLLPCNTRDDQ